MYQDWPLAQSGSRPNACKERLPGSQLNYWVCLTSVLLLLWWLLWDNTSRRFRCLWHHLLAAASRIRSRNLNYLCGVSTNPAQRYVFGDTILRCHSSRRIFVCSTGIQRHCGQSLSQALTLKSLGMDNQLDRLGLSTKLRESHQLSLVSLMVQANVGAFAPYHKEWPNLCPNKISLETKVCITWLCSVPWAGPLKTCSMTHTLSYKSTWEGVVYVSPFWVQLHSKFVYYVHVFCALP